MIYVDKCGACSDLLLYWVWIVWLSKVIDIGKRHVKAIIYLKHFKFGGLTIVSI